MTTSTTPANHCPNCGYATDHATSVGRDAVPKAGDFSVCVRCRCVAVFNADKTLRLPTSPAELQFAAHIVARLRA